MSVFKLVRVHFEQSGSEESITKIYEILYLSKRKYMKYLESLDLVV